METFLADTPFIAFCPHCGNQAPQREVYRHVYQDDWYEENGQISYEYAPTSAAILRVCGTCNHILLYDGMLEIDEFSSGEPPLMYPHNAKLHDSVPKSVREEYGEASRVKTSAPNAFAVLIRRALEAICTDRSVPQNGPLAGRLKKLAERGDIPPTLVEMTDVLRTLGNMGAHCSDTRVTVPMAWAIDGFFRAVVEYVYIAPSKLAEFRKTLEQASKKPQPPDEVPF